MRNLLIEERPLVVSPSLACKFGLLNAVVLQQIHFLLKNSTHFAEGKKWIYNTYDDWAKMFPFAGESTIRKVIKDFEKLGVLVATDKFNKMRMDKTKWYSIDYDKLAELTQDVADTDCLNVSDDLLDFSRGVAKNEQLTSAKNEQTNNHRLNIDLNIDNTPLPPKTDNTDFAEQNTLSADADGEGGEKENLPAKQKKSRSGEKIDFQGVIDIYNQVNEETGSRLSFVETLNEKRKRGIKKLLAVLHEPSLDCVESYFRELFSRLRPFHLGEDEKSGSSWRANFDWAIREETLIKVREDNL